MSLISYLQVQLYMNAEDILKFAATSPYRYKFYRIKKRNGRETRLIAHPSVQLKFIQRLVTQYLSSILSIHECAYAYRKGIGIKDNAQRHLHSKYLLKMDFKDFFPSISPEMLFKQLRLAEVKMDKQDAFLLERLLFCRYQRGAPLRLSIGAPSSPFISNFVMMNFDDALAIHCSEIGVSYTRYADDITFSTSKVGVLFNLPEFVSGLLNEMTSGLISINPDKTIFSSKAHNRHVTGVTLSNNNKLTIGREKKRVIYAKLHHLFVKKTLSSSDIDNLRGHVSHAIYIEPDFYNQICKKYGQECVDSLIKNRLV
ncbi:MAG: retron St85 family RNA-directed DNA polymerase [Methylophaga sp.]